MTDAEKNKAIEYAESVNPPAEKEFFTKQEAEKIEQERQKMDRSRLFVKSVMDKDDFEEQIQKAELEGRIFGPSQMSNMNLKFRALDEGMGDRTDLNETLVSKSGQRVIMSGRLQALLGQPFDGYWLQEDADQLASALQADGVPGPEIDRVNSAMNRYGAIILQRGIFNMLKLNLEDSLGRSLSQFSSTQLSDLSAPAKPDAAVPEHGISLDALRQQLSDRPGAKSARPGSGKPAGSPDSFKKELDREVNTPELAGHKQAPELAAHQAAKQMTASRPQPMTMPKRTDQPLRKFVTPGPKPEVPLLKIQPTDDSLDQNAAWRMSSKVVAPKMDTSDFSPRAGAVPKVRNRVPRRGLSDIKALTQLSDINKLESAHLRQGPLKVQLAAIRDKIAELARKNDMLPVSLLPAFVQSPLFQTYLKAGAMLIDRNMTGSNAVLDNVMAELEQQGQDTLSQEEFEAVADLKKELESMSGL